MYTCELQNYALWDTNQNALLSIIKYTCTLDSGRLIFRATSSLKINLPESRVQVYTLDSGRLIFRATSSLINISGYLVF